MNRIGKGDKTTLLIVCEFMEIYRKNNLNVKEDKR